VRSLARVGRGETDCENEGEGKGSETVDVDLSVQVFELVGFRKIQESANLPFPHSQVTHLETNHTE